LHNYLYLFHGFVRCCECFVFYYLNMKKISFLLFVFLMFRLVGFAQIDEETTNKAPLLAKTNQTPTSTGYDLSDKLMLGGNLSLSFGSMTMVEVSPLVGYNVKPWLTVGASLTYMYFSYKDSYYDYSSTNYGASLFTKIKIYKDFYAQIEPELLNYRFLDSSNQLQRQWFFNAFAGVTYRSRLGERFAVDYSILWNLNQTTSSPYQNPYIKVAFVY